MSLDGLAARWLKALGFSTWVDTSSVWNTTESNSPSVDEHTWNDTPPIYDVIRDSEDAPEAELAKLAELSKEVEEKGPFIILKNEITTKKGKNSINWVQKQKVTPGRIAWFDNKVRWWELHHNDKLPTPNWKIYSPVNWTIISIKNNYKENRNWWSLKNPSFWNYIIIKVEWWEFDWLTYHLGHIDKDIPLGIWDKVRIWDHIWNIKYGSWSGTWIHYSDAIWWENAKTMASSSHKWFEDLSSKLANVIIQDTWIAIYWDWSKDTHIA